MSSAIPISWSRAWSVILEGREGGREGRRGREKGREGGREEEGRRERGREGRREGGEKGGRGREGEEERGRKEGVRGGGGEDIKLPLPILLPFSLLRHKNNTVPNTVRFCTKISLENRGNI